MPFLSPEELNSREWLPEHLKRPAPIAIKALVSCDLASMGDYTAISSVDFTATPVVVRGLERMRGVPYVAVAPGTPGVVERVSEVVDIVGRRVHGLAPDAELTPEQRKAVPLVLDKTGVGQAIFDLFVARGLKPVGITITGGNKVNPAPGGFNVPKRDLVFALVALFQTGNIKIAAQPAETQALVNELTNFKMKISQAGRDTYEAWRESQHDDLVLSVAMAAWYFNRLVRRGDKRARTLRRPA